MHTSSLSIKVVTAPDPKLRTQTKQVKKIKATLLQTLKEMVKLTLTFKDPEGVGLASTQVGLGERFFVGKIGSNGFQAFINPQIMAASKRNKTYFEGCLSIPDYYGQVKRALSIKVSYLDTEGKLHQRSLKGVDAWIFQHEVDHLDGVLFPDRVLQQKGRFFKYTGKDKRGSDMYEEVTI